MKKMLNMFFMCIITMVIFVGCGNGNNKKTDVNLFDFTNENQTTELVTEPSSEYIEPTTSPKPTYEVTPYDLCSTMQELFDKQTQQAFKSRAPGTQKPISPSVFPMSSYMVSDWDASSFKGIEHTYNILAGGLAYADRGESVSYSISVSPVKSNFYKNSFVYYSGSKAEISIVFKIDINSSVEHNQSKARKNSGYAVAIFELSPNNPNVWLLSFLGEANENTIDVLDYSNFILINEDGSSDYEDILAAEQESKKKAEEELASIEASKEAQRNEELERELAQLKLITDRIIEQSGYIDDGSHNYVAYNFDGNHFISDGNKCAYYIDENGEFVVHDYNEDEAFVPQCIFFDEDDEGNIIHELLPVDVNVENGFFQFNGINCDNIGSNTYKLGTEIYYGYNNKTEKMGGICAYTVINQYYIIISNDYKRYRNIYLLDTESYDVEFLLDNPIFDIVSWNIDEEGEGDIYIVDGEVVDEDTFWSVRNNILEVPEDCVLGVGNNIDLLIENIKDNYIIE